MRECCGEAAHLLIDEPMGQLYICGKCLRKIPVFYDKPEISLDGIREDKHAA